MFQIFFDGCEKITERSVIALSENCHHLTYASFKSCNVKLVPEDILNNSAKFEFKGCPVTFLRHCINNTVRQSMEKLLVVREQIEESLIGKDGKKSTMKLIEKSTIDNFNVYQCHYVSHTVIVHNRKVSAK